MPPRATPASATRPPLVSRRSSAATAMPIQPAPGERSKRREVAGSEHGLGGRLLGAMDRRTERDLLEEPGEPEGDDREQDAEEEDPVQRVREGVEELGMHPGRELLRLLGAQVDAAREVLRRLGRE